MGIHECGLKGVNGFTQGKGLHAFIVSRLKYTMQCTTLFLLFCSHSRLLAIVFVSPIGFSDVIARVHPFSFYLGRSGHCTHLVLFFLSLTIALVVTCIHDALYPTGRRACLVQCIRKRILRPSQALEGFVHMKILWVVESIVLVS
jgi:hypothetical protein